VKDIRDPGKVTGGWGTTSYSK